MILCEGFVLKKDQKKDSEEEQISLEDLIEREVITSDVYSLSVLRSVMNSLPGCWLSCGTFLCPLVWKAWKCLRI